MRALITSLVLLVAIFTVISSAAQKLPPKLSQAAKLIVVTTPDWDAVSGTLTRYQRKHNKWDRVGKPIAIVVGKTGLAWDPSLAKGHGDAFPGPVKH